MIPVIRRWTLTARSAPTKHTSRRLIQTHFWRARGKGREADRIYVQAKRYAEGNTAGFGAIRDFFGSLDRFKATNATALWSEREERIMAGLFVTASTVSSSTRQTAEQLSKRAWFSSTATSSPRLMIRHGVACRIEKPLYVKKVDEEFFE
jgi:restriction system protein